MDMINTQMFPEVSSSSVNLKQQEVVNFFKGEDTMLNAFQSLDESYQRFAMSVPYRDIPGNSEYTASFGKFLIKNIDQPVEVLETMITHYQVAEVVASLTLSSHLFHVVSLPLFITFCIPLLQQGNMVSCLEAVHKYCVNFFAFFNRASDIVSTPNGTPPETTTRARGIDRNPQEVEIRTSPPIRNAGVDSSTVSGIGNLYQRKSWLVGITSLTSLGIGGYFFSQSFSWGPVLPFVANLFARNLGLTHGNILGSYVGALVKNSSLQLSKAKRTINLKGNLTFLLRGRGGL